jgi:signal transduction histidine kinase
VVRLDSVKWFAGLPAAELERLQAVVELRRLAAGEAVFQEGDPGDGVYFVQSGRVQISATPDSGGRHVFARVGVGEVFGEMAVLDGLPRSAWARAEVDTTVGFVPRAPLVELLRRSPDLALTMVQEVSRRLREFDRRHLREVLQAERLAVLGRFAQSVVHDLKNPLAIIQMAAALCDAPAATREQRRLARQRIETQVTRITGLVNDILDFSRETPSAPALAPVDYAQFIREVMAETQPELEWRGVSLVLADPPPAVTVLAQPQRLGRVLHNLCFNAADAMPGGGRLTLRFETDDRQVITELADTGPGLAPEMAARLFEPFATHGKAHGTGLGLAICRRIIEEHQGRIAARNDPAGGAVFSFSLPRRGPEAGAVPGRSS